MEYAVLIFTGFIGGVIAGMLGLGGGIFYILVLPYIMVWFGIPAGQATPFVVANSLIGIAFASGASILTQFNELRKYLKESLLIGVPAVVFSVLATKFIVHRPWFSREVFGGLLILMMLFLLFQMLFQGKKASSRKEPARKINTKAGISTGSLAGFISALSGLGGGIIINPVLHIYLHQSLQKARIISLATIFISAVFISLENCLSLPVHPPGNVTTVGYIVPLIAAPLIFGVIIGGPFGVRLSQRLPERTLKQLFTIVVLMVLVEKTLSLF